MKSNRLFVHIFPISQLCKTRPTNHSHYSSLPSPHNLETVTQLISIFNKQPTPALTTTELSKFGSTITTDVVETALKSFNNWEPALKLFNWASNQPGYHHTCYTYSAMASILSGARQNAAMKQLYIDLVSSDCYVNPGVLGYLVKYLGRLGMVTEANELFDHVKKLGCVPNEFSYNLLLEAISKTGCMELMTMRINEMKDNGWKPDKYTLTSILQCCCMADKFENAFEVFQKIHELDWVDSYVFTILIISLTKAGEVDKAIILIDKMDDFKINLNEKTYYVLIHGFVKNGKVDYAISLLNKMQSFGFVPGISLYAVLIEGLCKNKDFTKVLQLYSQMNQMGIHPDLNVLKLLASAVHDDNDKDIMLLLKEAKDHVNKKSMTTVFNTALTNLVNGGSIDKAHHHLRGMMKIDDTSYVTLDSSSFGIVIDGLCQKGELDTALTLFNDMDQIGCEKSLLLYNNLINALSIANKVEKCHELLKEMKTNRFAPSEFTHNAIFGYYCKITDIDGAINMLREIRTHGHQPWIKHYTMLVKKLSVNLKVAEACNFMTMMVEIGFVPDIIAYSAVINGWLKIGEVDYALKMFKDISVNGRYPDVVTYNTIISGLCKAKRVLEARNVYNEMVQKSLIPSVVTYNLLIDAYCKDKDIDKAVSFYSMMAEKNRKPNVVTYTTLIDGLCNAGRSDEALLIWNEMTCSPNVITYMALVNGLCKNRKPDEAFVFLKEMENKNLKADTYVYVTLVDAFIYESNASMGLFVLRKMIQDRRLPVSHDKKCVILREAVVKLLDDASTFSEIQTLIADGDLPIHLLQT